MKINKSELNKIILEEIQSDPELLDAIDKLTDSIGNLDISIDFLSSLLVLHRGNLVALISQKFVPPPWMKH